MTWTSKGIVTFPSTDAVFQGRLSGVHSSRGDAKVHLGLTNGNAHIYDVGAFSNGAATATRNTSVDYGTRIFTGVNGTVTSSRWYAAWRGGTVQVGFRILNTATGTQIYSRTLAVPSSTNDWENLCYVNSVLYVANADLERNSPSSLTAWTIDCLLYTSPSPRD